MHRAAFVTALCVVSLVAPAALGGAGDLKKALEQARSKAAAGDADGLDRALQAVLAEGGKPAVKGLLDLLTSFPAGKEALYWQVVAGATSVTDRAGLDALGDFLTERGDGPQARDLMLGLQGNRSLEVLELHRRLLRPRSGPLQLLAVDRLGELERPEAVDLLLELFKREEKSNSALERRIKMTLTGLFGEDMGMLANWEGWWARNRDTAFAPKEGASATGTVKDGMDRARQGGLTSMQRGGKVLVIRGRVRNYDEIEKMLDRLGVRHQVVEKIEFVKDPTKHLQGVAALILNCNAFGRCCYCPTCKPAAVATQRMPTCSGCDKHDWVIDEFDDTSIDAVKTFVSQGGCVFTEDLGLKELTGRAWKEHVKAGPDMPEREIDYAPAPGQSDPALLRGVLVQPAGEGGSVTARRSARWKVDNLSPYIVVVDPSKVQVLLASEELKQGASEPNSNAVAVAFYPADAGGVAPAGGGGRGPRTGGGGRNAQPHRPRGGLVLHVLSHFGHQKSQSDEFTLQNLLVNFLLEAQDRYAERSSRR